MNDLVKSFITELKIKNYAFNTIKIYRSYVNNFLKFTHNSDYEPVDRIKMFLEQITSEEKRRNSYNAVRLFYELVIKKDCPYVLKMVTTRKRLPQVFTKQEVLKFLNSIQNKKHRLLISMLYGSGLRVSEVVNIRVGHLDFENMLLIVKDSKNKKDRLTPLSHKLKDDLLELRHERRATEYLFKN